MAQHVLVRASPAHRDVPVSFISANSSPAFLHSFLAASPTTSLTLAIHLSRDLPSDLNLHGLEELLESCVAEEDDGVHWVTCV